MLKNNSLVKIQQAERKTAMYNQLIEIAAANADKGMNASDVAKALDEMVVAKVYPSTEYFDYEKDGGITKNKILGAIECKADEYYPVDTKPAVNPADLFKFEKGNNIDEDGKPFKPYGQQK